jgi:uncharacterized protein YecT (DUF1311 family)
MKSIFSAAIFTLTLTQVAAASFDCAKANSPSAKQICSDPKLSKLDDELAVAWSFARSQISVESQKLLVEGQRSWLRFHSTACFFNDDGRAKEKKDSIDCQVGKYESRIKELGQTGKLIFDVKTFPYFQGWTKINVKDAFFASEEISTLLFDGTSSTALALNGIMRRNSKPRKFSIDGETTLIEGGSWWTSGKVVELSSDILKIQFIGDGYDKALIRPTDPIMETETIYFSRALNRSIKVGDVFKSSDWKVYAEKIARQHFKRKGIDALDISIFAKQDTDFYYTVSSEGFLIDGFLGWSDRASDGVTMRWRDFSKFLTPLGEQLSKISSGR